jgi:hypothetical protein
MRKIEGLSQLNPVARLQPSWIDFLATSLSRAFHDEPSFVYVMPDEEVRHALSQWFFRSAIHASQRYGEIYTADAFGGAALWISPQHNLTFGRMVRTRMIEAPFKLGWSTFRSCIKLAGSIDGVRKRLASGPHWYLMALAGEPSGQLAQISETLIAPILSRADSTGTSCYTETFDEKRLGFYKRQGFQITGAGKIPGGGPQFWALIRAPRR